MVLKIGHFFVVLIFNPGSSFKGKFFSYLLCDSRVFVVCKFDFERKSTLRLRTNACCESSDFARFCQDRFRRINSQPEETNSKCLSRICLYTNLGGGPVCAFRFPNAGPLSTFVLSQPYNRDELTKK